MTLHTPASLHGSAETLAAGVPALLAAAETLATTVTAGNHGRRRAGSGDHFWQYRRAENWDDASRIDWRRSGRSDQLFVQEREWQLAQSVLFWADSSQAMSFSSALGLPTKAQRAQELALALAIVLERAGERFGPFGSPPKRGRSQIYTLAQSLLTPQTADYAQFPEAALPARAQGVVISDFMGDLAGLERLLAQASANASRGLLVQLLDPQEEAFPFKGRTLFENGKRHHETRSAEALRDAYLERLAARKDTLSALCRHSGWRFISLSTAASATAGLLQLHAALSRSA